MRFRHRVALVTGAGRGIGRAIALRLGAEGLAVAVTDIDVESARGVAEQIPNAVAVKMDVTSAPEVDEALKQIRKNLGPVEIAVNNAGWDRMAPFLETTPELWDRIIAVDFKGTLNVCKAVLPEMVAARSGRIINIGSDAGRVGSTGQAVYSGCKGAVIAFSKALAREVAAHQVTVNVVAPGPTDTPILQEMRSSALGPKIIDAMIRQTPLKRLATPEDIAGAVAFLASAEADYITGQVLSVSGGLTMAG